MGALMVKKVTTSLLILFVIVSAGMIAFKASTGRSSLSDADNSKTVASGVSVKLGTSDTEDSSSDVPLNASVSQEVIDLTPTSGPTKQYVVAYFYTNTRCNSCMLIEKWTSEALLDGFGNEMDSNILTWKTVNTDVKANEHFLKDFDMYTKSVIVIEYVDGKATRHLNLDKVWNHLRNEGKFKEYVISETRSFIYAEAEKGGA